MGNSHITTRPGDPGFAQRFWAKVLKTETCWVWIGRRANGDRLPYGTVCVTEDGKSRLRAAHRIAWELTHGSIPVGLCVCHHCDNPPCVRPDHLFLGTYAVDTPHG